jgi:hypothetical protein
MRVIVTGSRQWTDADAIRRELARLPSDTVIIHGDCEGADTIAGKIARELGLVVEQWDKSAADYQKYQKAAWKGLNERMLSSGVVLVLAFHPDWQVEGKPRGTNHMLALARDAGVEVRAFRE